ncbi:hypothetical protein Syun_025023 [Stephania yunnanensis]|uniref:Uncharacterized protein n=1 Tax=Stephania yunnanensis TaxID=152371 RepID=A0AAP0HQV4_9MAGN
MEENEVEELTDILECLLVSMVSMQAILQTLHEVILSMYCEPVTRTLTRRSVTRNGFEYIETILNEDAEHFRQIYRMYPDVFRKLCKIIREKALDCCGRYLSLGLNPTVLILLGTMSTLSKNVVHGSYSPENGKSELAKVEHIKLEEENDGLRLEKKKLAKKLLMLSCNIPYGDATLA